MALFCHITNSGPRLAVEDVPGAEVENAAGLEVADAPGLEIKGDSALEAEDGLGLVFEAVLPMRQRLIILR